MNTNFNLFNWIREGVKQSILMGVSDAVETIGTPENPEEINPQLAAHLQPEETKTKGKVGATKRKRLGRGLSEMDSAAKS